MKIETTLSRSEDVVLLLNGTSICSRIDPWLEAQKWIDLNCSLIESYPTLIVLGLGAGYHIIRLAETFPNKKIHVIENNLNLIELFDRQMLSKNKKCREHITCHWIHEYKKIKDWEFRFYRDSRYAVLRFNPRCFLEKDFYSHLEDMLIGRKFESFVEQARFKNNLTFLLENKNWLDSVSSDQKKLLSINEILSGIEQQPFPLTKEQRIWKTLGELIK